MARNGSGTYSLPEPAFVPNTVISSTAMNSDLSDIASALTASLARDGQGGMTDVLPLDPTGFEYTSDSNTGMYRTGADAQAIKCGGVDIITINTAGAVIDGDVDATTVKQNGFALLPPGVIAPYAGLSAPDGWLLCYGQSLLRASYTALFDAIGTSYGAADGTHFSLPDLRGRVPAGKDDMGGSAASRLTATTMTPDGATLAAVGGTQTHTLTAAESAVLTYTSSVTDSGHTHTIPSNSSTSSSGGGGGHNIDATPGTFATSSATTGVTVGTTANAGGGAHNNVQPSIITNYIIYAGV